MGIEVREFAVEDVDDAARLLADRHRTHRIASPLLSPRFEQVDTARAEIEAVWAADDASGAMACRNGRAVGYLLGASKPVELWGPNVWIEASSHAVDESEVARDLYGLAAQRWVDEGRTAHFTLLPAHDPELLDAWSRLGFGQQHVHAVRESPTEPYDVPAHLVIRRAARADIPALAALDLELPLHQGRSPVFSPGQVETLQEAIDAWEESIVDPEIGPFVAEHDGRVIGQGVGVPLTKSRNHAGLSRPDDAGFLAFAAVTPDARGLGAGRALGERVLWWSTEAGYPVVVTDWRATNLLSSRTWPRLGFRPSFVRVHRLVGY